MSKKTRVLDSWGVVAFLEDEQPAAEKMEELFAETHEAGVSLLITTVNLGEVWYSLARAYSEKQADQALDQLLQTGVEVVPADWDLTYQAARLKVRGSISYADCFAVALAKSKKAEVVTGDKEFKQVEGETRVYWI
jgi:predicted nucleic acid-binding protein